MNNFIIITLSLLLSIVLTITTFPLGYFAPDWIHLFLIYWILATPSSIGLLTAWVIGHPSLGIVWCSRGPPHTGNYTNVRTHAPPARSASTTRG